MPRHRPPATHRSRSSGRVLPGATYPDCPRTRLQQPHRAAEKAVSDRARRPIAPRERCAAPATLPTDPRCRGRSIAPPGPSSPGRAHAADRHRSPRRVTGSRGGGGAREPDVAIAFDGRWLAHAVVLAVAAAAVSAFLGSPIRGRRVGEPAPAPRRSSPHRHRASDPPAPVEPVPARPHPADSADASQRRPRRTDPRLNAAIHVVARGEYLIGIAAVRRLGGRDRPGQQDPGPEPDLRGRAADHPAVP